MYISFLKALDITFYRTSSDCGASKSQKNRACCELVSWEMSETTPMKSYQHLSFNRSWTRLGWTRHANIMGKA